jgi:tetratricopeptide (TPR) repeat protein/DNA-binding CsgD family transcriptional regulator|tara:strand:+ start:1364 stop:3145 length:1782 start_codon:yes stop_codon:yes gene_type:complete
MGKNATKFSKANFPFLIIFLIIIVSVFIPRIQGNEKTIDASSATIDSIKKYKIINPNKAIEFCFEVFTRNPGTVSLSLVDAQVNLGDILFSKGLNLEALEYYNSANTNYHLIPIKKRRYAPWILVNIGNVYYSMKDFDKAAEMYEEAITYFNTMMPREVRDLGLSTCNDNLALVESSNGNVENAIEYAEKSLDIRLKLDNKGDIIYSYSLLIGLHLQQDSIDLSFEYLNKAIEAYESNISINDLSSTNKNGLNLNLGYLYMEFYDYYYAKQDYIKSIESLDKAALFLSYFPLELIVLMNDKADILIKQKEYNKAMNVLILNDALLLKNDYPIQRINYFNLLSSIYVAQNDFENANNIKDSILLINSVNSMNNDVELLGGIEIKNLLSNKEIQLIENENRYRTLNYIYIAGFIIIILILVSMWSQYRLYKEKSISAERQKQILNNDLGIKKLELTAITTFTSQRNDHLKNLKHKIKKFITEDEVILDETNTSRFIRKVNRNIDLLINSDSNYKNFENQFVHVYPDFHKSLLSLHPSLSASDLRLCSYIKMNQSSNEIAQLTGVSIRTVESQRYRLRKKLDLGKDADLNGYLILI